MHRLLDDRTGEPQGDTPARLTPELASFRNLVMVFVRDYIGRTGGSPSYGEIAAKLGTNSTRCKRAVKSLVREGRLIRLPGHRGLRLPTLQDASIAHLRERGWIIDEDARAAVPPDSWFHAYAQVPVPKRTLLTTPALDYPARRGAPDPGGMDGDSNGGSEGEGADARARDQRAA